MADNTVQLQIPPDIYAELNGIPMYNDKIKEKIQLDLAVGMFVSKEISLSRAAEFAGLPLNSFADILLKLGIPTVEYTESMLADDIDFINNYEARQ